MKTPFKPLDLVENIILAITVIFIMITSPFVLLISTFIEVVFLAEIGFAFKLLDMTMGHFMDIVSTNMRKEINLDVKPKK